MVRWLSIFAVVLLAGCAANRPVMPESGFMAGGMMFKPYDKLSTPKARAYIKDNYIISIANYENIRVDDIKRHTLLYNKHIVKIRNNDSFNSGRWHYQGEGYSISDKGFRTYKYFFHLPESKNLYLLSVDCMPMHSLTCDNIKLLSVVLDAKTQSGQ